MSSIYKHIKKSTSAYLPYNVDVLCIYHLSKTGSLQKNVKFSALPNDVKEINFITLMKQRLYNNTSVHFRKNLNNGMMK